MDPRDKALIIDRYTERHRLHGRSARALGSGSDEHQTIRYSVLSAIGDMSGRRVLDVGCGYGGFYGYNRHLGEPMFYTGIDIVPALLEEAKELVEEDEEAKFLEMDILDVPDNWEMDYVVSSQAFNNKLTYIENWELMKQVLAKCYKIAKIGVAIDMMSSHVDFQEEHLYYYDPCRVFDFCKTLTKRVQLRHDYPLYEFCIYMFPDFAGWREKQ